MLAAAPEVVDVESAIAVVASKLREGSEGPPTDLEAVGARLGVARFEPLEDEVAAGELFRATDGLVVRYAPGTAVGRRRFTIAHELGHAFFETTGPNCPKTGTELERICDLFAVELLMPAHLITGLVGAEITPEAVLEVRDRFRVSLEAARRRCLELFGAHSFVVREGDGLIDSTGLLSHLDDRLERLERQVLSGEVVDSKVFLPSNRSWNGPWRARGRSYGDGRHALFTLVPIVNT